MWGTPLMQGEMVKNVQFYNAIICTEDASPVCEIHRRGGNAHAQGKSSFKVSSVAIHKTLKTEGEAKKPSNKTENSYSRIMEMREPDCPEMSTIMKAHNHKNRVDKTIHAAGRKRKLVFWTKHRIQS